MHIGHLSGILHQSASAVTSLGRDLGVPIKREHFPTDTAEEFKRHAQFGTTKGSSKMVSCWALARPTVPDKLWTTACKNYFISYCM